MTDLPEKDLPVVDDEVTAEPTEEKSDYIEFVGQPPHGTEFYGAAGTHTVTREHMKKYHDVDLGAKEVVWKRGANGRFLVPVNDLTPEAVAVLEKDPLFKRVTL